MKSTWKISVILLSATLLTITFNNCGQNGSITSKESTISGQSTDVEVIISNCAQAIQQGKIRTLNQNINFEDSRVETGKANICNFAPAGQTTADGNLSTTNGQMRSRYEQHRKLNLPANAVLCDVQMSNNLQSFRYDDVFFFNFNNYLLATNNRSAVNQRLNPTSMNLSTNQNIDLFTYDWTSLRTAGFSNVSDDYCIGQAQGLAQCSWPVTEQQGSIKFQFNSEMLIRMSANVAAENQTFSFVITGDDDPSLDCYHEKLAFSMAVKYYIK